MSIAAKHAYRFSFLRSEEWQTIRSEILLKFKCRCYFCDKEDFGNDVHHVKYPSRWANRNESQLLLLCRECHTSIHQLIKILGLEKTPTQWRLIDLMKLKRIVPSALKVEDVRGFNKAVKAEQLRIPKTSQKIVRKLFPKTRCVVCTKPSEFARNVFSCFPCLVPKAHFNIALCDSCFLRTQAELRDATVEPKCDREAFQILEGLFQKNRTQEKHFDSGGSWCI